MKCNRVASAKAEIGEDGYDDFGMRKKVHIIIVNASFFSHFSYRN